MNEENNYEKNVENNTTKNNDNSEKNSSTEKSIKKKRIILAILIVCIIISIVAIILGVVKIHKQNNQQSLFDTEELSALEENELNEQQKKFIGINDSIGNNISSNTDKIEFKKEENYTDIYKEYLELPDKEKEKLEVIPRKDEVPIEKFDELKDEIVIEDTIPSSFNLADKINLKVEDQGEYSLCWDFASMNSLETFLALHENKEYDFSEIHADYITSKKLFARGIFSMGGTDFWRDIHDGGNFEIFRDYLKLTGPVLEENLEYKEYEKEAYQNFIDMDSVVNVTETVDFPKIPIYDDEDEYSFETIKSYGNIIKSHMMENGSLYAVTDSRTINEKNATQYCKNDCFPDHAVSIVGWDDNYSKDNFADQNGDKPKHDGAYIALNTWGDKWGNNGYFYISYEDVLVGSELSGILSTSKDNNLRIDSIKNEKVRKFLDNNYGHLYFEENGVYYLNSLIIDDITEVNMDNYGVKSSDLDDILSTFPNLDSLYLPNNEITDLSPLSYSNIYYLDLSNNKIKDIKGLPTSSLELSLSNNEISDISALNDLPILGDLDISNNNINWNENMLSNSNISWLNVSNTKMNNISFIKDLTSLYYLNISNNSLDTLKGIENFKLGKLDISSNSKIKDYELLNKIDSADDGFTLYADNCGIQDIAIFNDLKVISLSLENNQITDLSRFNNNNVTDLNLTNNGLVDISSLNPLNISYINLSKNPKLKGLESIKNISTVILQHNELDNLEEVKKLTGIVALDLSYNKIKDYTELNSFKNLSSLSLEGNDGVKLDLLPKSLKALNVKNCNLDNNNDLSKFETLFILNISGNNNFKNLKSARCLMKVIASNYELTLEELKEINEMEIKYVFNIENLTLKIPFVDNNVKFEFGEEPNQEFMRNVLTGYLKTNDIILRRNVKEATITGENPTITTLNYNIVFKN